MVDTTGITAYEQFLGMITSIDVIAAHKRIDGKFISKADAQGIHRLSCTLWGIYRIRRDNLHDAGVDWKNACNYAASHTLNLFAMAADND